VHIRCRLPAAVEQILAALGGGPIEEMLRG
jgi:hypothetical protein